MNEIFGIAVKCVVVFDNKILLLSKSFDEMKGDLSENEWDLPGGRVNYGETIESAVMREVKEETGLEIEISNIFLKNTSTIIRPDGLHLLIVFYKCFASDNIVKLSDEHNLFKWIDIFEVKNNEYIPEWIKDAIDVSI